MRNEDVSFFFVTSDWACTGSSIDWCFVEAFLPGWNSFFVGSKRWSLLWFIISISREWKMNPQRISLFFILLGARSKRIFSSDAVKELKNERVKKSWTDCKSFLPGGSLLLDRENYISCYKIGRMRRLNGFEESRLGSDPMTMGFKRWSSHNDLLFIGRNRPKGKEWPGRNCRNDPWVNQ